MSKRLVINMGLRFRKSINLGNGTRLNINKRSVGVSVGTKGVRYSVNSDGRRTTSIGIPGTGLYWTNSSSKKKKRKSKGKNYFGCLGWLLFLICIGGIFYYLVKK